MAISDFPKRIGYTWKDEVTGTPYGLVFDNPQSAISFIVTQRNNLVSADEILASLTDAETGKSLADESIPTTSDDITAIAPAGVTLPEAEQTPETSEPVSDDTTANASPVAASNTASEVPASETVPGNPPESAGLNASALPTEVASDSPIGGSTGTPASVDSGETSTVSTSPLTDTPTVSPLAPSDSTEAVTEANPDTGDDDEDDDFDAPERDAEPANADDAPESEDQAPSIGTPTVETPGVTGTANTNA